MKRCLVLFLLAALSACRIVFAAEGDRFKGGSNDGYDDIILTGVKIPEPPPKGTLFSIGK